MCQIHVSVTSAIQLQQLTASVNKHIQPVGPPMPPIQWVLWGLSVVVKYLSMMLTTESEVHTNNVSELTFCIKKKRKLLMFM
jgi:hypothetical protein